MFNSFTLNHTFFVEQELGPKNFLSFYSASPNNIKLSEVYLRPFKASMMEIFCKNSQLLKAFKLFSQKHAIIDV